MKLTMNVRRLTQAIAEKLEHLSGVLGRSSRWHHRKVMDDWSKSRDECIMSIVTKCWPSFLLAISLCVLVFTQVWTIWSTSTCASQTSNYNMHVHWKFMVKCPPQSLEILSQHLLPPVSHLYFKEAVYIET